MIPTDTYKIKIDQFEGPFDLLLFFIERDELDIHDIPISKITNDFLAYIKEMQSLNIDLASEFIWVASKLMRIKSKMLLPRTPKNEAGEEIDPRKELVQKLIEYKKFKEVLPQFQELERQKFQVFNRGNSNAELKSFAQKAMIDSEWETLDLYQLLKTFHRLLERKRDAVKPIHKIVRYPYSIEKEKNNILRKISAGKTYHFLDFFKKCEEKMHIVYIFLSMLDLINNQVVTIENNTAENIFQLKLVEKE